MTDLTVGKRLRSPVCDTEIIVVHAPDTLVELRCGGQPMAADAARNGSPLPGADQGTVLGKRYVDDVTGLEVLCVKPGIGGLVADGRQLALKAPKALPASD
jgi:hypothetical protein